MPFPSFPHHTLNPFLKESKHLWKNEAGPEKLDWGCSRDLNLIGKFLKKWMEKGLHSQENALGPSVRRLPSLLWGPSPLKAKRASENYKSLKAFPCLTWSLSVLGWSRTFTSQWKTEKTSRAQSGNAEHGGGRAVGLSGAWREQATSTIILFQN